MMGNLCRGTQKKSPLTRINRLKVMNASQTAMRMVWASIMADK